MTTLEIRTVFDQAYDAIGNRVTLLRQSGQSRLPGETALADELGISRETVRRVLARYAEERVVVSQKGRGTFILPRQAKTFTVLYDSHLDLFHPWLSATMRVAAQESRTLGCRMNWQAAPEWGDEQLVERLIGEVRNLSTDGYVAALPLHHADCRRVLAAHVPLVMLDVNYGSDDVPAVLVRHEQAGRLIGTHLAGKGHRRTALITGPMGDETIRKAQAVLAGLQAELGARVPRTGLTHIVTDRSYEQARAALQTLLALPEPPDAIVTTDDESATAAVAVLRKLGRDGRRSPQVMSYVNARDNLAELIPWTIVQSPPVEVMGRDVVRMLHQMMAGETLAQRVVWHSPALVVREEA